MVTETEKVRSFNIFNRIFNQVTENVSIHGIEREVKTYLSGRIGLARVKRWYSIKWNVRILIREQGGGVKR